MNKYNIIKIIGEINERLSRRRIWIEESKKICKEKVEAKRKKWDTILLDSRLDNIKHAVLRDDEYTKEYAQEMLDAILAEKSKK